MDWEQYAGDMSTAQQQSAWSMTAQGSVAGQAGVPITLPGPPPPPGMPAATQMGAPLLAGGPQPRPQALPMPTLLQMPTGMQPSPAGAELVPGARRSHSGALPANDFSQHYVDCGERPQNFLSGTGPYDRYDDPRLAALVEAKDAAVEAVTTPAYAMNADLRRLKLNKQTFGTKFDVILIDPPWHEYVRRAPGMLADPEVWSWQDIQNLTIEEVADTPSFIFLWCGSAEGLDAGRHCFRKWGFKRIEDIVWLKTNTEKDRKYLHPVYQENSSVLAHVKEHCLVGEKGFVHREDGHFVHSNVDIDVIVSEEPPLGSTQKPEELYSIIQRLCLGRRRLELFGENHNVRPGWVTVGRSVDPSISNFRAGAYIKHFEGWVENPGGERAPRPGAPTLVPSTQFIEDTRPRSPVR